MTSAVCKVLEATLKEKMLAHLSQFSLLNSRQHGFLPQRSTLTNLLLAEELFTKWLDEGSAVDLLYLDFTKAFVSVNHRLLAKLRGYGIAPTVINWVHRTGSLQANVNGTLSQTAEAISGAPSRPCHRLDTIGQLRQCLVRPLV